MNHTSFTFTKPIVIIIIFLLLISCGNKRPDPKDQFNEKTPGRKVVNTYDDKDPQVVYFYEVDENKNVTNTKIGEMYYYHDNKVYVGGGMKNNLREGVWKAYHPNGKIQTDANYINGKEDGEYTVYYDNGQILYSGHYTNGNCDGEWKFYSKQGRLTKKVKAEGDQIVCGVCPRCLNAYHSKK
ncbi:MAG TPA: hypothetical protein PLI77_02325 [Bacteroidales bacterium]|nr:hypothetical protein [Bacteroidales bacterium]